MDAGALWEDLRQGARNVAGVTWQVNVCVYLLIAGFAGELPFVRLTPEGYEDADCEAADGARTFVQMKEVDGGFGRLAAAAIAEALAHAEASARGSEITLITDGSLGSGLAFTGWSGFLSDQQTPGVDDVIGALVDRGYDSNRAKDIVTRARVVRLQYRVREMSEGLLALATGCHATVSGLAVSRLTEIFAVASAEQRRTQADTAQRVRTSDIDTVVGEIQDTVDVQGLDHAQRLGICAPADFLTPDAVPARTFYLGVDGRPSHVASNLDVVRPVELTACAEGLVHEQSVLIIGPSGSGKSVLLWRAARDLIPAARVLRVQRVATEQDAADLARHVRLMRPSEHAPVLVVADDLGRPATMTWPGAATLLREVPHTYLLGASRAEDFHPSLLVGATRVVQPRLDKATAVEIGSRIRDLGITQRMDVQEALESSEGLLMEFLALLTTGQRLREVLAGQVADLANPDRRLQRDAARLLTAAHTLGLSLRADRLGAILATAADQDRVGDALGVLREEHVIIPDGTSWRGLHELRSATISQLLHENPPPTIGTTWARVVDLVDPGQAGWMLRRVAERSPQSLPELMPSVGRLLAEPGRSAADVAKVLEGAERADNTLYVQASTPILRAALPQGINIETLSTMVYPMRNQSFTWDSIGSDSWDRMVAGVRAVAEQMPLRVDFDTTLAQACAPLTAEVLERLLREADIVDAVRLLEAGREHLTVPVPLIRSLIERVPVPHDVVPAMQYSRLIAASTRHVPSEQYESIFGTIQDRALAVAAADPWSLEMMIDVAAAKIGVERLLPVESATPAAMDWDVPRANASNVLNTETMACLERLVDACPELKQFAIRTVTASGTPHHIADHEPAHKDMAREVFPDRASVRQSVGYQAALRRATASQTWTEVVIEQIELAVELTALAEQTPLRIKPNDNNRRRSDWRRRLTDLRTRLAALDPPPMARGAGPALDEALHDDADRTHDATARALSNTADALDRLCPEDASQTPRLLATAMSLRSAVADLRAARAEGRTVIDHRGSPIPDALISNLERAANLTAALHADGTATTSIRAADPLGSSDEIWARASAQTATSSQALLDSRLGSMPRVVIQHVLDPDPQTWSLDQRAWLITTAMDDLDAITETLNGLTNEERDQLGARIVVLAVGFIDPTTGADPRQEAAETPPGSAEPRRVSLDAGYQLSFDSSRPSLPLTPDVAAEWAEAGGLARIPADPAAPVAVLDGLIIRSVNAALSRMRRLPSPAGSPEPSREGGDHTADAPRTAEDLAGEAVAGALRVLGTQVAAEEAGTATTTLAGVALSAATGGSPTDEEEVLLRALAIMHFARFDRQEGLSSDIAYPLRTCVYLGGRTHAPRHARWRTGAL